MGLVGSLLAAQASLRGRHKDAGGRSLGGCVDGVNSLGIAADVVKDLVALLGVERGNV